MEITASSTSTHSNSTLRLNISKPTSFLNVIAKRYDSPERILMEYVDNGLDDVEPLYREHGDSYPYPIHIEVEIDAVNRYICVRDNGRGMTTSTLIRIVENVGESQKASSWLNGEFGFGFHAFRAAAEQIIVRTKHVDGKLIELILHRDQYEGISHPKELTGTFPTEIGTGTEVIIGPFSQDSFETLGVETIKKEIELHFERLLSRPNLKITVKEVGHDATECKAFDYDQLPGDPFKQTIDVEHNNKIYSLEINLKVSTIEVPGRRARFFNRGRRINDIAEIKSFRSSHSTSVWGHPHLVGFIDVADITKPVITRDDFVKDPGRKKLYKAISMLEPEVRDALTRVNEAHQVTTMHRLEDIMRDALNQLAREDQMDLRSTTMPGHFEESTMPGNNFDEMGEETPPSKILKIKGDKPGIGEGITGSWTPYIPENQQKEVKKNGNQVSDNSEKQGASKRQYVGLDIKFADLPADFEGYMRRSQLIDGIIYINTSHPDFQARLSYYSYGSRRGRPRFTDRLGYYLASTVSIHYKDEYYTKYGRQPERRDQMFDEQVEFTCRLEKILHPNLAQLEKSYAGPDGGNENYDAAP